MYHEVFKSSNYVLISEVELVKEIKSKQTKEISVFEVDFEEFEPQMMNLRVDYQEKEEIWASFIRRFTLCPVRDTISIERRLQTQQVP